MPQSTKVLDVAAQIPLIEPLDCKFTVPGESYVPPSSTSHVDLRFIVKSPAQKSKPDVSKLSKEVNETQLKDPETLDYLRNPLKVVEDQPKMPLYSVPPYFPDVDYVRQHSGWVAFLVLQKDGGKLADVPNYITRVDLSNLKLSPEEFLESKAIVSAYKFPLSTPTPNVGTYHFRFVLRNLLYFGSDLDIPFVMNVENKPVETKRDLYEIEDPDEDSIAGAFAQMRGESVKKFEHEYESSDDEDDDDEEEESDWTDIDTDTEDESDEKK
ncbi:unnamed protein product [Ambrosiozyma monospora]|uniref:Unnamed protein product n=1 Tax=Ambrosiozyma monospora TaxID=43982 RepID=A0ACB5TC51_AMBMO|nr:unnamed protein product [Ambrosiozyma monospora]